MAGSSSSSNNNSKQKGNNTSANGGGGKQKAAAEPIKDKKAGKGTKASKDTKTTKQSSKDTAIPTTGTALAAKPVLFNGWTGKTPATLLNEYVQKQPTWHRASYNVSGGTNTGGYTCSIHLSKIDPKNKSTPLAVHLRAPTSLTEKQPTPVEARHMAATYALYRMRSDTSMYLSLPPEHRAYWALLQERREDGRWKYAADPFLAQAEREKAQAEGDQARAKRAEKLRRAEEDGHREELLAPGLRARWEEMAEARMAEHHRLRVEAVVREWTRHWGVADQDAGTCTVEGLVRLGFRPAHAEEALLYARSKERAVDWLCVHVPEDDLPRQFISRVEAPSVVRGGRVRAAAERALAQCGFATALVRDAVARAAERLGDAGEDAVEAVAAQLLVARLLGGSEARHGDPGPGSQPQPPGPELLFAEEVESLQAIFHGEGSRVVSKGAYALSVQLRPRGMDAAGDLRLEVWVPPGLDYPGAQAPFMAVSGALPAFLKLHVARKVAACVRADGLPVVFDAVCAAEDGLAQWVAAPPPLVELRSGVANAGAHEPSGGREPGALGAVAAPKPGRRTRPASNGTAQLAAQFARLQTDAAYQKMQAARRLLPAHARQAEIVAAVAQSGCTVIAGATGCGKTTQVPQFLLDDALRHGRPIRIVCTQPRRISAIGVATRVADERAETLGRGTVGYAVKGDAKQGADTRLLFCTTGVLLRMLGSDPLLEAVTHVVCDEVHERSVDSDLLLALLRECAGRRPQLRVVLMSATAQSDVFAAYFGGRAPAPALSIPGRTFPVDDVFVEDFARESALADVFGAAHLGKARARLAAVRVRAAAADADAAAVADAAEWLRRVGALQQAAGLGDVHAACVALWDDRHGLLQGAAAGNEHSIDFALVAAIVRHIHATAPVDQSVLVFVPGAAEIRQCIGALPAGLHVLALHAGLSAAEQRRVFDRPPKGSRKVVVATNVAETSITIEDIGFVVDSGRVREACRDAHSGIARLATRFCSQAAATQRRGRAGRMQRGTCYRVYTRQTLAAMREHAEPEILRTPLEQVSLQAKALGHSDSLQFMQRLLTPPEPAAAQSAELLLVALGACDKVAGPLGALGRLMAEIPVDLRLAKMLVYAVVFGCLDRALVLAALMAHDKPLFAAPFEKRDEARRERMRFAVDGHGDWIADLCAYEYVAGQRGQLDFVSRAVMRDVRNNVRSLREALAFTGLSEPSEPSGPSGPSGPSDPLKITRGGVDPMVLRAVVFAGLSPSIARVRVPKQKYYEVVGGAVGIDREAREMAFYAVDPLGPSPKCAQRWQGHDMRADRRVFIHPQSTMFSENRYAVPFVTFFALTQSGAQKTYMRDVTVPGMYALLLFGPQLVVDPENKVVCVGPTGGLAVRAWPRVAVLVNQLRSLLDELLRRKLDDPSLRIAAHPVVEAVLELIRTDGK